MKRIFIILILAIVIGIVAACNIDDGQFVSPLARPEIKIPRLECDWLECKVVYE